MPSGRPGTTGPCKKFGHTKGRTATRACIVCARMAADKYQKTKKGTEAARRHQKSAKCRARRAEYGRRYRLLSDKAIDYEIDRNAKRRVNRATAS